MIEYNFNKRINKNNNNNNVSLIIVTSPIQSHPSNDIIKECINSVIDYPYSEIIISYDKPPKNKKNRKYELYIERMKKEYPTSKGFKHLLMKKHGHFFGTFYNALEYCKSKYVFLVQHDIKLSGGFPIDKCLSYNFNWNIIATHHMKDGLKYSHWFPIIQSKNRELLKVWGWSERIFLTKRDWMMDQILGCQSGIYNPPNYKPSNSLLKLLNKNKKDKLIRTENFIDTIFHKEFDKLFKKTQNIKSYKSIGSGDYNIPINEYLKIYNDYWNEWKCYLVKSEISYHAHLFGRTAKTKKTKKTKRKTKRETKRETKRNKFNLY